MQVVLKPGANKHGLKLIEFSNYAKSVVKSEPVYQITLLNPSFG
jgi:hypothetical protein